MTDLLGLPPAGLLQAGSTLKLSIFAVSVLCGLHFSLGASAQERGFLVRCDIECIVAIDGKVTAVLEPDQEHLLPVAEGKHTFTAVSSSGDDIWETKIDFDGSENIKIPVSLLKAKEERTQLESQAANLKTEVAQKQRQFQNVSTLQYRVFYKQTLFKVEGHVADLRISAAGIELLFLDGGGVVVPCSNIVKIKTGQSKGVGLMRHEFVINTKKRSLYIIVTDPSLPYSKFTMAPKIVKLIMGQIRSACGK